MIKFNTWAVFNKGNHDYPDCYVGKLFKWENPTDEYFRSTDIDKVREWIIESNKYYGNKHLICLSPAPNYFPYLLEIWS